MAGAHGTGNGDEPTRFVCKDCYVISSGIPEGTDAPSVEHYKPPDQCGACGGNHFVRFTDFNQEHQ